MKTWCKDVCVCLLAPDEGIAINSISMSSSFCCTGSEDGFLRLWSLDFTNVFLEAGDNIWLMKMVTVTVSTPQQLYLSLGHFEFSSCTLIFRGRTYPFLCCNQESWYFLKDKINVFIFLWDEFSDSSVQQALYLEKISFLFSRAWGTRQPGFSLFGQPFGPCLQFCWYHGIPRCEEPQLQHTNEVTHRDCAGLQCGWHPSASHNCLIRWDGAHLEYGLIASGQ